MTLPPKLERLLNNWPAKIVAFIVALFLYAYYQITTFDTRTFTVPLSVVGGGGTMLVGLPEKQVRVSVRGYPNDLNQLSTSDFTATVDYSRVQEAGDVAVPVQLQLSDLARSFDPLEVLVSPIEVRLTLENRVSRYVPLSVVTVGEVPAGYEVAGVTLTPHSVRVVGPESTISSIESLDTKGIFLTDRTSTFTTETQPYSFNELVSYDHTEKIKAEVTVRPVQGERTFSNVPIVLRNVGENVNVRLLQKSGSVVLRGSKFSLDSYRISGNALWVDASKLSVSGTHTVPVQVTSQGRFETASYAPHEVQVVVEVIHKEEPVPVEEPAPAETPEESAASAPNAG